MVSPRVFRLKSSIKAKKSDESDFTFLMADLWKSNIPLSAHCQGLKVAFGRWQNVNTL